MRSVIRALWREKRHTPRSQSVSRRLTLDSLEVRTTPSTGFTETALVSNVPGLARHTDPNLVNPWGFAETADGKFRVAANGTGRGILLNAHGARTGPDIIIPPPAGSPAGTTSTPNGVVTNPTSDFVITVNGRSAPATLLFSTEDGTIAGWNPRLSRTQAVIAADESGAGAIYKLLALGQADGANYIYATDFHNGTVDVFDKAFAPHTFFAGQFTDPNAPAGFAPFGVKNVNGTLFVTFAKQDADAEDDVAGPGNGFIDEFDTSGHFLMRFASGTAAGGTLTALNSPIGAAIAPAEFGNFGGDLLIGNFGDSHVSAFDPTTGAFLGQLQDAQGQPLVLDAGIAGADGNTKGLWGIGFGTGRGGADTRTLFFAAGPNDETDGVFGMVAAASSADDHGGHGDHGDHHPDVDIGHDLADLQADISKLQMKLGTGASVAVTADLSALGSSLTKVATDVAAGTSATADLGLAVTADATLAADLGTAAPPRVHHLLRDLGADLADLMVDLAAAGS